MAKRLTSEEIKNAHNAIAAHARKAEHLKPVATDRHMARKDQAAAARKLFRILGIKGVRFTTPNYSMASVVDVDIPKRDDYKTDERGQIDYPNDPAAVANNKAVEGVRMILAYAFPNHDNRSDSMTDYFDACWSF